MKTTKHGSPVAGERRQDAAQAAADALLALPGMQDKVRRDTLCNRALICATLKLSTEELQT